MYKTCVLRVSVIVRYSVADREVYPGSGFFLGSNINENIRRGKN
jgi:hypothetical protein